MAQIVPATSESLLTAPYFLLRHGGAETNVAVTLAALGTPAAWFGRLGDDALGHRILDEVKAQGVDVSLVVLDPSARTGVFFKDPDPAARRVLYYRDDSAASRMNASDIEGIERADPLWIHVSGVTAALSPSCLAAVEEVIDRARRASIPVSFDVNYRPVLWPDRDTAAQTLRALSLRATVVFVGLDEADDLWGATTSADVRELLPEVPILVVKDGPITATEFGPDHTVAVPALQVEVVEPVGAGDAFAAGWIHGFLNGSDASDRLSLGHLTAREALLSSTDQGDLTALANLRLVGTTL